MAETREFHIADILSITHEYLISTRHMGGVYDVLNYLTGQNLMTHQLGRAADETRGALLAQLPQWATDMSEEWIGQKIEFFKAQHEGDTWLEHLVAHLEDTHGQMFPLQPVSTYHPDDPIEEFRDMMYDQSKVIAPASVRSGGHL